MRGYKGTLKWMVALMIGSTASAFAVLSWPGCKVPTDADFKVTDIVTRAKDKIEEPQKMAFDLLAAPGEDAKDKVDVYFTERKGLVRKFDSKQGKVLTLATFNLTIDENSSSDGILGIALDPDFKKNHQLYLFYTYIAPGISTWRISRFTLDNSNSALNMASEAVILSIPMFAGATHTGGAIQFDAYGDLWITVGNDFHNGQFAYSVWSSSNTMDLRGKILRIHPTADGHYTIPAGNLYPPGTAKTKPEIYIMGTRNPYTLSLDPARRWAAFGDVGPDATDADGAPLNGADAAVDKTEEQDLAVAPGNYGYPYFAGANYPLKKGVNPLKPIVPTGMDWMGVPHNGLDTLPPATPAIYPYQRGCAITGPIYRYDGDLNSSIKFPPHFDRKWFFSDFNAGAKNPITLATLSADGKSIAATEQVLKGVTLYKPLDFQQGPDGALYVINYAGYRTVTAQTGIVRIEYTGDCRPAEPKLETPTSLRQAAGQAADPVREWMRIQGRNLNVTSAGAFHVKVLDLQGKVLAERSGQGEASFALPEVRKPGVYFLVGSAPEGSLVRKWLGE